MGIIKDTLNKQIQNNNIQQFNDTTATIIEYNIVNNTAKIRFLNPNGEGIIYRDNVAIANTLGGVTGAGIYPGQPCTITFMKNNIHTPIITGLINSNYSNKTCSDQGAYIVDSSILSFQKPTEITPMMNNWIEENNNNVRKYNNDLGDYTQTDASESIHEELNTLDKYKSAEQGITNLNTKSTMKLKENGDIDMFVANNIGIRICPNSKTIEFYGMKFLFNGNAIEDFAIKDVGTSSTILPEDTASKVENATIPDIIKVSEISNLFKELNNNVAELKLCIQYTIDIMGNAVKFTSLKSKIENYEMLKYKYYNETDNLTHDFIVKTHNTLLEYKETFNKELKDASGILGGV